MARTADYAIQGFIYQFIITLSKLLKSPDDVEILVEGVVEDIDILHPLGTEAIQCKYHEAKTKFNLSSIYKPVLQMMVNFKNSPSKNIKYRLHAHFPSETVGTSKKLTPEEINEILLSKSQDLQKMILELSGFTGITDFLDVFEMEFGASYEDSQRAVIVDMSKEGYSTEDVEEIFYPNAIHSIAERSIKHDAEQRKITKRVFFKDLENIKKTAISRWTKELESFDKLLKKRKDQLRDNLNHNWRKRCLILDSNFIKNFDSVAPNFIEDYLTKYNSKPKLNHCPTISIIGEESTLNKVWITLNNKGVVAERGLVGDCLDVKRFLREPLKNLKEGKLEFNVRICNYEDDLGLILDDITFDDLYVISDKDLSGLKKFNNMNTEVLVTQDINQVKYLLSINSHYGK